MAIPGVGYKGSIIGIGEESPWGTAVARTNFYCANSMSLAAEEPNVKSDCINSLYRDADDIYQGNINVSGDLGFDVRYEGIELFLKHLFWSVTTTNPGTLAYNHQFKLADTPLDGLTLEKQLDSSLTTGKSLLYEGCSVNSMDFTLEPGGIFKTSVNIMAEEESALDTVTSPTLPTASLAMFNDAVATLNSTSANLRAFNLTINRQLTGDRYFIGSRNRFQPVPSAKGEITGSVTIDYDAKTLYEIYRNNTTTDLNLTLTGALIEGGQNYTFSIDMPKIKLTGSSPNIENEGIITQEIPFEAHATDSATREVEINVKNTLTSV